MAKKAATPQVEEQEQQGTEKISKMEAVRTLLAEDPDMQPQDGIQAIKERWGLEMNAANFSAYKSQIRSKAGKGSAGKGKGGRPKKQQPAPAATDPLEAAQQVQSLVKKYGAATVKGLADLFGQEGHG